MILQAADLRYIHIAVNHEKKLAKASGIAQSTLSDILKGSSVERQSNKLRLAYKVVLNLISALCHSCFYNV